MHKHDDRPHRHEGGEEPEGGHAGPGHNRPSPRPAQWQTPHRRDDRQHDPPDAAEPDLDLVEAAFVEGFEQARDPSSFLRLARVPFVTERAGRRLELVRVEILCRTDVASVTPYLGGAGHRVAPLPEPLVARRRTLRFVYLGPARQEHLTLADIRPLPDLTPQR
jgi:hypothetical protein